MIATHNIQSINFNEKEMELEIDGKTLKVALGNVSKKLLNASEIERNFYKVSASGYGIHWPLIDEDISVEALMKITS